MSKSSYPLKLPASVKNAAAELARQDGVSSRGGDRNHRAQGAHVPAFGCLVVALVALGLYLGSRFPPPTVRWDHIVWGYIKMGKAADARQLAERIAIEQPDNASIIEARGYLAAIAGQYADAVTSYQRAIALRPRSYVARYNLAKAYLALGDTSRASEQARAAMTLNPSADIQALLAQIAAVQSAR